jgi:hypothetical protein
MHDKDSFSPIWEYWREPLTHLRLTIRSSTLGYWGGVIGADAVAFNRFPD